MKLAQKETPRLSLAKAEGVRGDYSTSREFENVFA